ncbi:dihydropteroate synthase [Aliifodinibius salicampi]|uniref:Dihydropteroate synthase n=1 Tax=Fodinibius salicampi TaxID=1920655 RepID=A0ABT3PYG0_9BACT|nr:dihydropteroate synthase [Fodinibius salicampi]MCW9712872.1 dihydropteroate synthase [Fodinibius salicampi]
MANSKFSNQFSVRGKDLVLSSPKIMGILNATPDSFSDGGKFNQTDEALNRIGRMISEGAAIIDIGGESTRPGAEPVSEEEEIDRVIPIIEKAVKQFPDTFFSIDTTKYKVAREALERGVHLVNDVSGLKEPLLAGLCAEYDAGYILMHTQGNPETMQENPTYDEVTNDVYLFLKQKIALAEERELDTIIIDPGIGFGKTLEHNRKLIADLDAFRSLGYPIMVGASRKSMIGDILKGRDVNGRLIGTIAVHYHAMLQGANIIRVHDVKEAHDSLMVYNVLTSV